MCFKSCLYDQQFNYKSPTATLAWMACEFTGAECANIDVGALVGDIDVPGLFSAQELQTDLQVKGADMRLFEVAGDADAVTAQRMCLVVGLVVSMPYLLLLIVLVYLLIALVQLPFSVTNAYVQIVLQMVFYSHLDA